MDLLHNEEALTPTSIAQIRSKVVTGSSLDTAASLDKPLIVIESTRSWSGLGLKEL